MFIGRQRELSALTEELSNWKKRTAVLVYGKRRVGKSTLIREAAKSFDGVVINYLCVTSTFEGNLELIYKAVSDALALPNIKFDSLFAMMDYLKTLDKKILLIIDEYPYLKQTKKKNEVDSYMQALIDQLPDNVKLILCGSYITIMKELLTEDNPSLVDFHLFSIYMILIITKLRNSTQTFRYGIKSLSIACLEAAHTCSKTLTQIRRSRKT